MRYCSNKVVNPMTNDDVPKHPGTMELETSKPRWERSWRNRLPFVICASFLLAYFVISPCVLLAVEITDEHITDVVEHQLILSDAVAGHKVDVASKDGIVTLTGSVDNLLARYQALQIAGRTKGVRSVVNRIEVEANTIDDEQLVRDIKVGFGRRPGD